VKVVGICGSPRPNGNTAQALSRALDLLQAYDIQTEAIILSGKTLTPCDGCLQCHLGKCRWDDDMVRIYESMRQADGIILASPVYFGQVTGQLKTLMDRTVLFRTANRFELSGKVGAGITCGAFRNGGQELALQCMHTYFLQQDMQVIADGPTFSHSGGTIVGHASQDELGMRTIENLARRMAQALNK
jgi:multimeric flavodoxin WrbA